MKINSFLKHGSFFILLIALVVSCASKKDVVYFQDVGDYETITEQSTPITRFKVDDEVSIYVSTLDPEASAPFNVLVGGRSANPSINSNSQPQQLDYLIDKEGEIDFPVIGKVKLAGLSPEEARVLMQEKLSVYLKDPIINIRLRNFSISVLGSVTRAGTYPVVGEQITILEALGLAGDIGLRGVRTNVLVIRDFNGIKTYTRIDLTSKNMTKSPVYYLQQNDVVYVEPNKSGIKETSLGANVNLTFQIISLLVTTGVILLTRL